MRPEFRHDIHRGATEHAALAEADAPHDFSVPNLALPWWYDGEVLFKILLGLFLLALVAELMRP